MVTLTLEFMMCGKTQILMESEIQKDIFKVFYKRACPTNGSDCGFTLRVNHNLTLFVIHPKG